MKLTKCAKGHFYDGERYSSCPHCQQSGTDSETVSVQAVSYGSDERTVSLNDAAVPTVPMFRELDDEKTVSFFSNFGGEDVSESERIDPCVGWLVCVEGSQAGKDFRITSGNNYVGRDKSMDICLKGDDVSRIKHAIITYDPKNNIFLALPGESHGLCYVNDEIVVRPMALKKGDRIEIGGNVLIFTPFCDENFCWKKFD